MMQKKAKMPDDKFNSSISLKRKISSGQIQILGAKEQVPVQEMTKQQKGWGEQGSLSIQTEDTGER